MAGWISSRLKVAEDFLHQIDQQAAESLKKNEKRRSDEELGLDTSKKPSEIKPLLKDQLKKKSVENIDNLNVISSSSSNYGVSNSSGSYSREKEGVVLGNKKISSSKANQTNLTDSDWTELLSVPSKKEVLGGSRSSNGVSGLRRERRDGRKQGSLGAGKNAVAFGGNRSQKGQTKVLKSERKSDAELGNKVNGDGLESLEGRISASDCKDASRSSSSSCEPRNGEGTVETRDLDQKDLHVNVARERKNEGVKGHDMHSLSKDDSVSDDGKQDLKTGVRDRERLTNSTIAVDGSTFSSRVSASVERSSLSPSNADSDSETDSGSSSDSDSEREREERRKRRQQILAEKAAAKAIEAIKQHENNVAKLEGEKQSLEKILEERAKQQVLEASELQTTTMETMEAVELEKQKHNNTRMEALARLAKLETTNADLARSLASVQKDLEVETNRISALRRHIELKEFTQEELRRKISNTHQSSKNVAASKGVELEREILEAENSFLTDKVGRLQEKAMTLEKSIESTKRELEHPTEVEVELKRRLSQLTDHLIQKQAQAEALSSEKAMLLFRIEAVSKSLNDKKSMVDSSDIPSTSSSRGDLESGVWELPNSKLRPLFQERLRSGKRHLGSLVQQLDSIYCAGAVFLRRNFAARISSFIYLACLHLWVIYILLSHSPPSNEASSGAVVSLENMNKTGGV
ncbi:golgin candidate 2-like [Coffea arabica]|uniref:Golgin candidate 2-like n=1 Tax=Coffea arabica TaxID=13443 RepID=A0ABM4U3A0_COFAR